MRPSTAPPLTIGTVGPVGWDLRRLHDVPSLSNDDELEEDESNDKLPKQLDVAKVVVVGRGNSVDLQFICCFS